MAKRSKVEILTPDAPPLNGDSGEPATSANDAPPMKNAARSRPKGKHAADDDAQPRGNFFHRLAQLTAEDWDRHRVYIYRRWPRITKTGEPHYIGIQRETLDEEAIKALYGSGRYLLKLNNARQTIDQTPLEIMDLASPPKVSPDELVDCPENEKFFKLWPPAGEKKPADGNGEGAVKELASLLRTVLADRTRPEADDVKRTLVDWALSQTSRDREQSSPAALAELVKAVKDLMPTQAQANGGAAGRSELLTVIAALKDMQPRPQNPLEILQQARDLFAPAAPANGAHDEIARLDQILGFAQRLASLRGPTGGERGGWDVGLDYLQVLVQPISQLAQAWMAMRGGAAPPHQSAAPAAGRPEPFDPYRRPDLMRQHATATNQPQPATPPSGAAQEWAEAPPSTAPTQATQTQTNSAPNQLAAILQSYAPLILNALNGGMQGAEFADHFSQLFGVGTHAVVSSQGEDALLQTMLAVPEIAMFGEARLRGFVYEFVHFEELLEPEEEHARAAQSNR